MKQAALYSRVSAVDQHPETQLLDLRKMAAQRGYDIVHEYTDKMRGANPPRPELIRRIAALLGGDADVLFRLAESTDPELAEYVNSVPKLLEFLRTAMAAKLSSDDFQRLIDQIQHESSSSTSRKKGISRHVRRS